MAVEISPTDVARAQDFLTALLAEKVENGRFTEGTALRDLTVKAMSFIFAHLQKENELSRSLQSLLNVNKIATTDPSVDRAVVSSVDAILSNWFITRNTGGFARGLLTIEVTTKQDYVINANNRFLYSRDLAFFLDLEDRSLPLIIPARDVTPIINPTGSIEGFSFNVRVIAARTGEASNVVPSDWLSAGSFSTFTKRIYNSAKFGGGKNRETTTEIINRSESAIAVRNLINVRSIDATLRSKFSTLTRLLSVGMGELEMQRDNKLEKATGLALHVGGHFDVYVELPMMQRTFEGQIGGAFTRPDGIANVFRDEVSVPNWTLTNVRIGDQIRISDGMADVPRDYTIREILPTELRISELSPFPEITNGVSYFIFRPLFGADFQVLPVAGTNVSGITSATVQTPNRITLPGGPHYDIIDVAIIDPTAGDPNINDADGFIHFQNRVNTTPSVILDPEQLEYQVVSKEPLHAQSATVFEEIELEPAFNGKTLRVTYDTLAGFDAIDSFTKDRFERILAANVMVRGFFPVYLNFQVPYRLKATATDVIDEDKLIQRLVDFINAFPSTDVIDVSDIVAVTRDFDDNIGTIFNFNINYDLIVPDGRILSYTTPDAVDLDPDKLLPEFVGALPNPLGMSLSDRTTRYITTVNRVSLEKR